MNQSGPAPRASVAPPPERRRRWPWFAGAAGVIVVAVVVVGALVFRPWLVFVDTTVDDEIPVAASTPASGVPVPGAPTARQGPIVRKQGTFISHEHDTSGEASVISKPDGTRVLAIRDLDTTTGPDVHVWLSAAPVIAGRAGWTTAGGADHVDLGSIKGNRGDQVYEIPADTDLARFGAVVLWCERFSVSFGAAELT
ncbi:DM13 domain-containing protein [Gordonia soli]|uniref:DM13 domain-containing protein n=1 Tax=Gordonia soli NBRC 108243 TaxID=1223545 RepID=M0QDC8_9ACTN|nr:DM13 domain-containing protein [Gordonia soli]GAC66429.1 hypothetical protein GS4_02_01400 [Gordonia soli NBRC 108243]